jgi:hypothetical protein
VCGAQVNAVREAAQVAFEQKDVQLLQSILPKATTRQEQVPHILSLSLPLYLTHTLTQHRRW